jgi:hypothetical protein
MMQKFGEKMREKAQPQPGAPGTGGPKIEKIPMERTSFIVQFVWNPDKPPLRPPAAPAKSAQAEAKGAPATPPANGAAADKAQK